MQINVGVRDVIVVIRSVGERTEAVCRNLIAQQVPQDNMVIVSNAPFPATLADSYRAGIERGLRVIGSSLGGIPEVIGNEDGGFLVPPGDPLALAMRMRELAFSPQLRMNFGRRARERILENFTWWRAAQNLLGSLSQIDGVPQVAAVPTT